MTENEFIIRAETRDRILKQVQQECVYQDAKWDDQNHSDGKWLIILIEELGEASESILEGNIEEGRHELIQSAAVLIQWIYDIRRRN